VTATPLWGNLKRQDGTPMHRFLLTWTHPERSGPLNLVVGMNPSGASATNADQTLLKVWSFSGRWNRGPFAMANVVAYRATVPRDMRFDIDEEDRNLSHVIVAAQRARRSGGKVVVAWGTPTLPKPLRDQFNFAVERIYTHLRGEGIPVLCLGKNNDGSPRHPLMLGYDAQLEPWSPR
jgi:hypothetical protein